MGLKLATDSEAQAKFDAAAVFDDRVKPVLQHLQDRDIEAVTRAVAIVHAHFERARGGAPAFAAAIIGPLNGVKTTYLSGKGVFERWWYHDPQIQPVVDHVRWNYEQDVTSGPKIRDAIVEAIEQLEQDCRANRNEALQAINSSLKAADLPLSIEIDQKQLDEYCQHQFDAAVSALNTDHIAEKAAMGSAAVVALSNVVTYIVEQAIVSTVGEAAVAAGGSVVTGTAGGAAVGSWVPGPGTVIGIAAGLLAGAAVDVWLSGKNKERTAHQVTASLTRIEKEIVNGDEKHVGLEKLLNDAAIQQVQQIGQKLQAQLKEAAR